VRGRRARRLSIETSGGGSEPERILVLVDSDTSYPLSWEVQRPESGGWVTATRGEGEYNTRLAGSLFAPERIPAEHRVDVDAIRARWTRRLSAEIARRRVGERTFVLRDLQINREGAVFLLYTHHRRDYFGRGWDVELRDDQGTRYLRPVDRYPFAPGDRDERNRPVGYVVDGEPVHGDWWVPLEPQPRWRPRQLTFTFRAMRPDSAAEKGEQPPLARFRLPAPKPGDAYAPEYAPGMAAVPGQEMPEYAIREWAGITRARYYHQTAAQPEQALEWYRQIVELNRVESRKTGSTFNDQEIWWGLFQVLHRLDRIGEARDALRQLRAKTRHGVSPTPQMEEAFQQEGIE